MDGTTVIPFPGKCPVTHEGEAAPRPRALLAGLVSPAAVAVGAPTPVALCGRWRDEARAHHGRSGGRCDPFLWAGVFEGSSERRGRGTAWSGARTSLNESRSRPLPLAGLPHRPRSISLLSGYNVTGWSIHSSRLFGRSGSLAHNRTRRTWRRVGPPALARSRNNPRRASVYPSR